MKKGEQTVDHAGWHKKPGVKGAMQRHTTPDMPSADGFPAPSGRMCRREDAKTVKKTSCPEERFQVVLERPLKNKTTIIVAHRLSSVAAADKCTCSLW